MKKILVGLFFVMFAFQVSAATTYIATDTLDLSDASAFDKSGVQGVDLGVSGTAFSLVYMLNIVDQVDGILSISTSNPGTDFTFNIWGESSSSAVIGSLLDENSNVVAHEVSGLSLTALEGSSASFLGLASQLLLGGYLPGTTLFVEIAGTSNGLLTDLDVSVQAVPVPAAVWLFGSALMGLVGVSRRKSTAVAA